MDAEVRARLDVLLECSDDRCRKLVELAEEGVWLLDRNEKTLWINPEMATMLGCTPAQMQGAPFADFQPLPLPGRRRQQLPPFSAARQQCEIRMQHRDGSELWLSAVIYPILDAKRAPDGRVVFFSNITARKRAERALRESERRYHDLFANAPVGIYRTTSDGLISMANLALVRMLGYSSFEDLTGQGLEGGGYGPISQREGFRAEIERDGEARGVESIWKRRDGSILFVRENARVARDLDGNILYFEGTVEDITERKIALQKMEQSEGRMRSLIDNAPYGIFQCDAQLQRFDDVNPALVQMLGYASAEELISADIADDIFANADECQAFVGKCRMGERAEADVTWLRRDGRPISVRVRGRRSKLPDGSTHLEIYAEDISRRAELEQQLRQAQKMEAIGNLAGGIAHDFNNLLMIISSYTQMMEEDLPPGDPMRQYTQQVLSASERSSALIQQLLAFSRKQILSPRILDLNTVVEETAKMVQRLIGEDIQLTLSLHRPLPFLRADPDQITQVLLNLCVNARDAMPRGGRIIISTSSAVVTSVQCEDLPGMAPGSYSVLSVTDNGLGMAAEVQSRIFEPFFTTKPLGKGTGLGLSMVYGIVQQSGGHIRLESELDRGTNFRIYFPAVPEEAKAAEHVEEAPQLGRGETVLVAEDEDSLRESIVAYLRQHGYTVLSACDGEEAMQVAREHDGPIHLLLTDVVMPRLEGGELAAELQRKRPGLATLFISGYTDQRLMTRLPDNPRPMVLQKPIKLRDLLNTIGEVMHPVN